MLLDKNSGGEISLQEAQEMIGAFQRSFPEANKAYFVGSNHLKTIMNQEFCIGVRIYNAYDSVSESNTVVLVGVDENGNDMKEGVIVDRAVICPPVCPSISILD